MREKIRRKLDNINILTFLATIVTAVIAVVALLLPDVSGVADDGSVTWLLQEVGLAVREGDSSSTDYLISEYVWKQSGEPDYRNLQTMLLALTKQIAYFVTGTRYFDLRFLGGMYLVLYLPAVFMITKAALLRTERYGSRLAITLFAILVFADTGYLTYFNSLYPEALIFILLVYVAAAAIRCSAKEKYVLWYIVLFTISAVCFCFVRRYCFPGGLLMGMFALVRMWSSKQKTYRITFACGGAIIIMAAIASAFMMKNDFNAADQLHAMSRGVLFQSENPEKTLANMGIDPSYSLLADVSAYEAFPLTDGYTDALSHGFFDHYTYADIALYYLKHPADAFSMFGIAVSTNLEIVRENCGSFTVDANRPAGARIVFGGAYSFVKNRMFPKTLGFFLVLVIACIVLGRSSLSLLHEKDENRQSFLHATMLYAGIGTAMTFYVIIHAGDAGLMMYNAQLGIMMDFLLFFVLAQMIDRLNIFSARK